MRITNDYDIRTSNGGRTVQGLVQPQSILRRFCLAAAFATMAVIAGQGAAGDGEPVDYGFREAPQFLALFAPRLHRQDYRAFVSTESLDAVLRQLIDAPQLQHPPGSWTAAATAPADAFGDSGTYNRFRLLRLYGATRTRVARGPRLGTDGRVVEAWTLISPYPSTDLFHLVPGTLLLVLRIAER